MPPFKAWIYTKNGEAYSLRKTQREHEPLSDHQVRVQVQACSLNYRDLIGLRNLAGRNVDGRIPLSDGAGTVVEVGRNATQWKIGDRVAACFFPQWQGGRFDLRHHQFDLGGSLDGMLSDYVVMDENAFVAVPPHLSFVEAATLPCAGVTAWQALFARGGLKAGQSVLVLGTGGVSIFGLQLASAAGAKVFVTSRSSEKAAKAKLMGAVDVVDTTIEPDWDKRVWELTERRGVDHVIEVGGPGTLERSMKAVAAGGQIHLIGVLTGFGPPTASLFPLLARNATLHGLYVGSREHFVELNRFVEKHHIQPVVDRVFPFDEAPTAFDYIESAGHFGKIVIEVADV
jgi:NADPH:quinone reductase-like Zn-dependent oxidoreductase